MVAAPDTIGSVYANPASTTTFVRGLMITNVDGSIRTLRVDWVPDSGGSLGTAADATTIFPELTLAAFETLIIDLPYALVMKDENESIQMVADLADKVNVILFGDIDA